MRLLPLLLLSTLLAGCAGKPVAIVPETIPTGTSIARATAYVDAADGATKAAKPHANATGKALLGQAQESHQNAKVELENADRQNTQATKQVASLATQNQRQQEQYVALENSTGVKIERFIRKLLTWVLVYLGAMVALRVAALFVAGPVGATMSVVATAMNPAAWFNVAAEALWYRKFSKREGK